VAGGELDPLVAALDTYERRRKDLVARRATVQAPRAPFDPAAVRRQLEGYLVDWRKLLRANVQQGQQVLRRLIKGRLRLTTKDGYYEFANVGVTRPLIGGLVQKLASLMPVSWNQIATWLGQVEALRQVA